jgi:hypothetical protein
MDIQLHTVYVCPTDNFHNANAAAFRDAGYYWCCQYTRVGIRAFQYRVNLVELHNNSDHYF